MDLAELEFENMYLEGKNIILRTDTNLLMLDKVLNMYDYVTRYGVDKSFIKVYNINAELDAVTGFSIAGNESFDYTDIDPAYKQACMEGIIEGVKAAVKWIIEKIKQLLNWIKEVWHKFYNLFDSSKTTHEINKLKQEQVSNINDEQVETEMPDHKAVQDVCNAARSLEEAIKYVDSNISDEAVQAIERSIGYYKNTEFYKPNWLDRPSEIMFRLHDKDRYLNLMQSDMKDLATVYVVVKRLMDRATEGLKIMKRSAEILSNSNTAPNHEADMKTVKLLKQKMKHTTELIAACNKVTKYILKHQRITDSALSSISKAIARGKDDAQVRWKYTS